MKKQKSNGSKMVKELGGFTVTIGLVVLACVVILQAPPAAQVQVLRDLLTLLGVVVYALYRNRR